MAAYVCRPLVSSDADAVRAICVTFFATEPYCRANKIDAVKQGNVFADVVCNNYLDNGLSIGAFDRSTGQLVGVRFVFVLHKEKPEEKYFSKDDPKTETIARLYEMLELLYGDINLFEKFGVDCVACFRGLCVTEEYQGRGIGTKMVEKTLELIRERGIKLVSAESSSAYSQRIFEKLDFEKLTSLPYTKVTYGGEPVEMTEELMRHKESTLFVKRL